MSKLTMEEQFSVELDDYLRGADMIHKEGYKENAGLFELGRSLAGRDFSKDSDKEAVFHKIQKNLNARRYGNALKKNHKIRRVAVAAASFALICTMGMAFMQTSFAQELLGKIKNAISLGHITVLQVEPPQTDTIPIPAELKDKVFDKDGKPLEAFSRERPEEVYTANGEKIVGVANGEIVTEAQAEARRKDATVEVKDPGSLSSYTRFKVMLPGYLPEGYRFDRAELFKDGKGIASDKYIGLFFINEKTGKSIYMQQRFADEETAYTSSVEGEIEKVKINGADAVISEGRSIEWEAGDVIYMLSGGDIGRSELIKLAESIK